MVDKDKDVLTLCQHVGYEAMSNLVNLMMIEFIGILKDIARSVIRLLYKDTSSSKGKNLTHIKSWRPIQLQEVL